MRGARPPPSSDGRGCGHAQPPCRGRGAGSRPEPVVDTRADDADVVATHGGVVEDEVFEFRRQPLAQAALLSYSVDKARFGAAGIHQAETGGAVEQQSRLQQIANATT